MKSYLNPAVLKLGVFGAVIALSMVTGVSSALANPSSEGTYFASAGDSSDDVGMDLDEIANDLQSLGSDVARELAEGIANVTAKMGKPSGMIVGMEYQGAVFLGYRKGIGTLFFHGGLLGGQPIYWNAPSVGFTVGASASKVAILVYGAHSIDELMRRFPSVEGSAHLIVGGSISYLRSSLETDDPNAINLAYVAVGIGVGTGVAAEYLAFTKSDRWF